MRKLFQPYYFLFWLWLAFLLFNLASRIVLLISYDDVFNQDSLLSLMYGMRMDTMIFCAFAVIFILLYALGMRLLLRISLTMFAITALFLEIATWFFYAKFHTRPNYLFVEHMQNISEISGMVWGLYPIAISITILLLTGAGIWLFRISNIIQLEPSIPQRWKAIPILLLVLFLGMRSSLDDSTPNPSFYTFSHDQTNNEIANNTMFSILFAWHWAANEYIGNYGAMPPQAMFSSIAEQNQWQSTTQLQRLQASHFSGKKNVILVILESFGAEHVGYLGGTPTTPNLDALATSGMAFTQMYAAGTRTSWGISSILTALYPLPNREYVKALKSQNNFYTIARSFKQHGYSNTFLYGGDVDFDNMRGFMLNNGYDEVLGKEAFSSNLHKRTWGYSDEDLYAKALDIIKVKHAKESPYFLTLLSLSSHEPFDYPQGKTPLYPKAPAQSFANSIKYADFALGKFYHQLQEQGLLKNTIIAFIADHANNPYGTTDVPVNRFHIAAVIAGQYIHHHRYDAIASQIDFGPTLLDLAGLDVWLPSIGTSVLHHERNSALLKYNQNYGYWTPQGLIVYKDRHPPQAYSLDGNPRTASAQEMSKGLANIIAPFLLYQAGDYHVTLPAP